MALDRKTSELDAALYSEMANSWYFPVVDPNEVDPEAQNKRILYEELAKLFLPMASRVTLLGDNAVRFSQYIQQATYQEDLGNKTGSVTIDWSTGPPMKKVTLTGNVTLTFTAPSYAGMYVFRIVQDATGARRVTWPTLKGTYPTVRFEPAQETLVVFFYDGAGWHATAFGLSSKEYNILDDPDYAAARAAGDFNASSTSGFLTEAGNRALELGCNKLVIPYDDTLTGGYYTISDTWKVPVGLSVDCQGIVKPNWAINLYKPAIEVGQASTLNNYVSLILKTERATKSNWVNDEDVAIRIHNLWNSYVSAPLAYGFAKGLQAYSTGSDGWSYNVIDVGLMRDNRQSVALWSATADTAWINQNIWFGGRYAVSSDYKYYLEHLASPTDTATYYPIGIYQYGSGTLRPQNANLFVAPSVEIESETTAAAFAEAPGWEIACPYAQLNRVMFARYENTNSDLPFMKIAATGPQYNLAELSYVRTASQHPADLIKDDSDQGQYNFVTTQAYQRSNAAGQPSWQSGNMGELAHGFDSSNTLAVPGLCWNKRTGSGSGTPTLNSISTAHTVGADYLEMVYDSNDALCAYLDTENLRMFSVKVECASSYENMRMSILCYDSSGTQLTGTSPRYAFLGGGSYSAGAFAGTYQTGANSDSVRCIRLHSSVKSCLVMVWAFSGGNATARVKSMTISSMDGGPVIVRNKMGAFEAGARYYNGIPSGTLKGNWKEGTLLRQYNPTDINDAQLYAYVATDTWAPIQRVYVGTSAPTDTNQIWIDTTGL